MRNLRSVITKAKYINVREERTLPLVLSGLSGGVSPELKFKVYRVLRELCLKKKHFGMIVVLGWRREWVGEHASVPDIEQNLFSNRHFSISDCSAHDCAERIGRTTEFDGAILVSREGIVMASGAYLENVSAKRIARKLHGNRAEDLSSAFGFQTKVHTRHLAAIAASFILKGTTIFTVSEEDGSVRIFERGRILWSTVPKEAEKICEEIKV